jgi:transposase
VIDYETFCKIHDCHDRQRLTITQTARALGLDPRTVAAWAARSRFEPRRSRPRGSVLDPFKPGITRLLDTHPYSAQQIFQRLREEGYRGGITILRDYVRRIRPTKRPVYLKLHFAPGECAQVDWGAYGTVAVGNTHRRLSFFVMVLAFSRQCSWSSPSPRPWSISSPATNTPSRPWVACRLKSWSTISNRRFCSA